MRFVHIRSSEETRDCLRLLAHVLGETMCGLLDRLVMEEAHRKRVLHTLTKDPPKHEKPDT